MSQYSAEPSRRSFHIPALDRSKGSHAISYHAEMAKLSKEMLIQIAAKRERMPAPDYAVSWRLSSLLQTFHDPIKNREESLRYFPTAVVATLEGYFRSRLALLIDAGEPFLTRAIESYPDIKLDIALGGAIAARSVGVGEIIMHNISMSSFASLLSVVQKISGRTNFLDEVALVTRETLSSDPRSEKPIISDITALKRMLGEVYETRHILCHEFGDGVHLGEADVRLTLLAAQDFIKASSVWLAKLQTPRKLSSHQRKKSAIKEREDIKAGLSLRLEALKAVALSSGNSTILDALIKLEDGIATFLDASDTLKQVSSDPNVTLSSTQFEEDQNRIMRAITQSLANDAWQIELGVLRNSMANDHGSSRRLRDTRRPKISESMQKAIDSE